MIYRKCDYRIVHNEKIFVGFTCASIMMSIWCCLDIYWCKQNLGMTQIALAGFLKAIHCHSYIKSTSVWCRFDVGLALGCSKELGPDVNTILHYILLIYEVDNNTLFKLLNELKLYSIQSSMQYNTLFKLIFYKTNGLPLDIKTKQMLLLRFQLYSYHRLYYSNILEEILAISLSVFIQRNVEYSVNLWDLLC